jgi:hypothetical protein
MYGGLFHFFFLLVTLSYLEVPCIRLCTMLYAQSA